MRSIKFDELQQKTDSKRASQTLTAAIARGATPGLAGQNPAKAGPETAARSATVPTAPRK